MATDSLAIINAVFPANARAQLKSNLGRVESELQAGFIDQYSGSNPADCAQARTGVNPAQYSQASPFGVVGIFGLGSGSTGAKVSSVINTALNAIPVVGQFLSGIWNAINPFRHHAEAIAKEQGTLCALIPQVNRELAAVDAAVKSGQISAVEADAELEQMVQSFVTDTASITRDSGSSCNAGCVMRAVVRAEADVHEQKYHDSPLYYLKHYWWIGAIALAVYFLWGGTDR